MEVRVLRYFLAVAQEESISAAAEYLHLTQPTLSRQLMDLEEELGKKLFVRGSRKISLTPDGQRLRRRAVEIVDLVDKTEAEFWESWENVSGELYIGGGEAAAMRLIAAAVRELQTRHPQVRCHLFSGDAGQVTERLDRGLLDFGVLTEPVAPRKYDALRLPAAGTWGVLLCRDSPLAAHDSLRPEQLWDLPLLVPRQAAMTQLLSQWFHRDLEDLRLAGTYDLLCHAELLVEAGAGYALCLEDPGADASGPLCFRPLQPRLETGLDVVWKKYQVLSQASEAFLEILQRRFSPAQ